MSLSSAASPASLRTPARESTDPGARLHGVWLALAWVTWSVLTLLCVANFAISIPSYLTAIQRLCQPGACVAGQPTAATAQALRQMGLSVGVYAAISVALVCVRRVC